MPTCPTTPGRPPAQAACLPGEHTIAELAELFEASRPTVYRVLERAAARAGVDA